MGLCASLQGGGCDPAPTLLKYDQSWEAGKAQGCLAPGVERGRIRGSRRPPCLWKDGCGAWSGEEGAEVLGVAGESSSLWKPGGAFPLPASVCGFAFLSSDLRRLL